MSRLLWPRAPRRAAMGVVAMLAFSLVSAQAPEPARGARLATINPADLKEWLTYLSSDELQGRQVFTEGYGIAAQYIAERLREFGVKPLGDNGTYFQIVRLRSYKVVRNSSITVEANGVSRTFKDGDHASFSPFAGGRQTLVFDAAELAGSPSPARAGASGARGGLMLVVPSSGRGSRGSRQADPASEPAAIIEYRAAPVQATAAGQPDIPLTTRRIDALTPPRVTADETFFAALFAGASISFADLKARLDRGDAPPALSLGPIKVTIDVNQTYQPITTQLSRNVVGVVEGADAALKDTYVLFGAHLDHVGYAISTGDRRGKVNTPIEVDHIWNGADDDGTGSVAELAIAKAFAGGPKPKRSVVFLWHTGEEADLYGSRFNADHPVVPLDKVQSHLNIDMIGRNRDDDPAQQDTVFVIGADRISTDLHNLIVGTNATLPAPLKLDYEYNDPADPNSFYTRSDHYSYASKGIPIAFFFTGTHVDYHANSDTVDKILFDKQARIAQLIYQVGFGIADAERELRRDHRGPRAGRGFSGRLD